MSNILLVDDSSTVAKVVSLVLTKQTHTVSVCSSIDEFPNKLADEKFDLIIFDFSMFRDEFIDLIKIPLIFTYKSYDELANETKLSTLYGKLVKPFTSQQLLDLVDKQLKDATQTSNSWSMDNFADPEISKILDTSIENTNNEEQKVEDKKNDLNIGTGKTEEAREEKTEVTDIVSKALTDNILNDIYGFEEQSEVKSLDEQNPILNNLDDGELSKDEQTKLLKEYQMEKSQDGTIEFKSDEIKDELNSDISNQTVSDEINTDKIELATEDKVEEVQEEKETISLTEDKAEENKEEFISFEDKLNDMNNDVSTVATDTNEEQDIKQEPEEAESVSDIESGSKNTELKLNSEILREELRSVLKEILPDLLAEVLNSQEIIDSVKKITMETAEHIVKEEINKIANTD